MEFGIGARNPGFTRALVFDIGDSIRVIVVFRTTVVVRKAIEVFRFVVALIHVIGNTITIAVRRGRATIVWIMLFAVFGVVGSKVELVENAVEEIIRWATPVLHMRRTATQDTELAGVPIKEDDKVVIFYASANFDDEEFTDPLRFDITRPVKPPQVSFGAKGPHHCLGAPLARMEIRVLLEEMIKQGTRFEQAGSIVRTNSSFVNGIAAFPAIVTSR